jgi:hypothetical protein
MKEVHAKLVKAREKLSFLASAKVSDNSSAKAPSLVTVQKTIKSAIDATSNRYEQ